MAFNPAEEARIRELIGEEYAAMNPYTSRHQGAHIDNGVDTAFVANDKATAAQESADAANTAASESVKTVNNTPPDANGNVNTAGTGGTGNHAALTNLGYTQSGHTGFSPTVHEHDAGDVSVAADVKLNAWFTAVNADLNDLANGIDNIPAARDFTANPILEPELAANAVTDSKIGLRAATDDPPNGTIVPINGKFITPWINGLRANMKYALGEIESIKNLGSHVGTFNTRALVPANASGFSVITINDFVNVRADETRSGATTRYIATAIAADGVITWTFDIAYDTDITGKMDTAPDAVDGNVAVFDDGQAVDSGIGAGNIMLRGVSGSYTQIPSGQTPANEFEFTSLQTLLNEKINNRYFGASSTIQINLTTPNTGNIECVNVNVGYFEINTNVQIANLLRFSHIEAGEWVINSTAPITCNGLLLRNTSRLELEGSSTYMTGSNSAWSSDSNLTINGTAVFGGSYNILSGSVVQVSGTATFNNLRVDNALFITAGANVTVSGTLLKQGAIVDDRLGRPLEVFARKDSVVGLTGNQTIGGTKTFEEAIYAYSIQAATNELNVGGHNYLSMQADEVLIRASVGALNLSAEGNIEVHNDIYMGDRSIKDLADPENDQDAATKKYVDENMGGGGSGDKHQRIEDFELRSDGGGYHLRSDTFEFKEDDLYAIHMWVQHGGDAEGVVLIGLGSESQSVLAMENAGFLTVEAIIENGVIRFNNMPTIQFNMSVHSVIRIGAYGGGSGEGGGNPETVTMHSNEETYGDSTFGFNRYSIPDLPPDGGILDDIIISADNFKYIVTNVGSYLGAELLREVGVPVVPMPPQFHELERYEFYAASLTYVAWRRKDGGSLKEGANYQILGNYYGQAFDMTLVDGQGDLPNGESVYVINRGGHIHLEGGDVNNYDGIEIFSAADPGAVAPPKPNTDVMATFWHGSRLQIKLNDQLYSMTGQERFELTFIEVMNSANIEMYSHIALTEKLFEPIDELFGTNPGEMFSLLEDPIRRIEDYCQQYGEFDMDNVYDWDVYNDVDELLNGLNMIDMIDPQLMSLKMDFIYMTENGMNLTVMPMGISGTKGANEVIVPYIRNKESVQ